MNPPVTSAPSRERPRAPRLRAVGTLPAKVNRRAFDLSRKNSTVLNSVELFEERLTPGEIDSLASLRVVRIEILLIMIVVSRSRQDRESNSGESEMKNFTWMYSYYPILLAFE
jgi:hypothetical protein